MIDRYKDGSAVEHWKERGTMNVTKDDANPTNPIKFDELTDEQKAKLKHRTLIDPHNKETQNHRGEAITVQKHMPPGHGDVPPGKKGDE